MLKRVAALVDFRRAVVELGNSVELSRPSRASSDRGFMRDRGSTVIFRE